MSIVYCCFMILLLCLSAKQEPCEARYIGTRYKGSTSFAAHFHYSDQGKSRSLVEKVQLQEGITTGGDSVADHDHKDDVTTNQGRAKKGFGGRREFSGGILRNNKQPLVYVSWRVPSKKKDNIRMGCAGREILESFWNMGLLKATHIKEPRRRGLSVKEAVVLDTANYKVKADHHVVVSDYEPPHGTPPIHNRQT